MFSSLLDVSSFFIGILINLLLIAMICFYFKKKIDNLELSQSEQAKMLYTILSQNSDQKMNDGGLSISLENEILQSNEEQDNLIVENNKTEKSEEEEEEESEEESEEEESEEESVDEVDEEESDGEVADEKETTILEEDLELQNKINKLSSTLMGVNVKSLKDKLIDSQEEPVVEEQVVEEQVVEEQVVEEQVVEEPVVEEPVVEEPVVEEPELVEPVIEETIKIVSAVQEDKDNLEDSEIKIVKNEMSVDYNKMTITEIRDLLKKAGKTSLPSKAKKSELIELLNVSE